MDCLKAGIPKGHQSLELTMSDNCGFSSGSMGGKEWNSLQCYFTAAGVLLLTTAVVPFIHLFFQKD